MSTKNKILFNSKDFTMGVTINDYLKDFRNNAIKSEEEFDKVYDNKEKWNRAVMLYFYLPKLIKPTQVASDKVQIDNCRSFQYMVINRVFNANNKGESKQMGNIPSDIFLQKTIPIPDLEIEMFDESSMNTFHFRITLVDDFEDKIDRFRYSKNPRPCILGKIHQEKWPKFDKKKIKNGFLPKFNTYFGLDPNNPDTISFFGVEALNSDTAEVFITQGALEDNEYEYFIRHTQSKRGMILGIFYFIQILLLNPVTKTVILENTKERSTMSTAKTSKKQKRKTKYIKYNYIHLDENEIEAAFKKQEKKFKCRIWWVIGHWRHIKKSDTNIWIKGYWKGVDRFLKQNVETRDRELVINEEVFENDLNQKES